MDYEKCLAELKKIRSDMVSQVQIVQALMGTVTSMIEDFEDRNKPVERQPQIGDVVEILECSIGCEVHEHKIGPITEITHWDNKIIFEGIPLTPGIIDLAVKAWLDSLKIGSGIQTILAIDYLKERI